MFDIERVARFLGEAAWAQAEDERRKQSVAGPRAPDRVSATRVAFFCEVAASLGEGPASAKAQELAARWNALLDIETGGDAETKAIMIDAWKQRRNWPTGLRRYVASLHMMDSELWERVTDFIEQASASPRG
jgi:hypothetical protein